MSKYFVEREEEKVLLSKHKEEIIKDRSKFCYVYSESTIPQIEYLIKQLGDVEMTREVIAIFCNQFNCFGGRYDVRTDLDTFKGVYEITKRYPKLSSKAIDEIIFIYIKDLFEKYELVETLEKFIKTFGETDECFEIFYTYVEKKADELQKQYDKESLILDDYKEEYGESFIEYLKGLVKRKHFSIDSIIQSLPSADLIKKDEEQIQEISARTRIYFGACYPATYSMTTAFIKGDIDKYPDQPSYYIDVYKKDIPTTFTKQEFLESIQKPKTKVK